MKPKAIEDLVLKLSKEGRTKAQIGLVLRDQYGIPRIHPVLGKRLTQVLVDQGIEEDLPEDISQLMLRAVKVFEHVQINPKDLHNKRNLALTEAKIRRLGRYYMAKGTLPTDWKYTIKMAKLTVG